MKALHFLLLFTFHASLFGVQADVQKQEAVLAYNEAMQALSRQDEEKAFVALKRAVALNPSLADAHYTLGMLYKKRERWKTAAETFQAAINADSNAIDAYCELGELYFEVLVKVTDAVSTLEKAIQTHPNHARARRLLGTAYLRQNRTDAAIRELQRAAELNPSDAHALYTLGLAYFQQDRFEAAISRFQKAIKQNPFHARAYFSLGNCYLRVGKIDEGQQALHTFERLSLEEEQVTHLKRLARQDPENVEAWYQLGRLQMKRKAWDAATVALEKCIALEPEAVRGYEALGFAYFQTGANERALEMFNRVVALHPNNATYRNSLGGVYLTMERYPEAIEQYQAAIRLNKTEPRFHLHLSRAYQQAGNTAEAEAARQRYEQLKSQKR